MKLQKTLVRVRQSRHMNIAQAAREIGISPVLLWQLETREQRPRVDTAQKIAKYYGLTIDQLIS